MCIYTLSVSVQSVPQSSFGVTMAAVFQTPRNVMVLMTEIASSDEQGCGRYHTILHEVNVVMDIKSINVWLILPCHLKSYIACYIASDPYTENLDLAIGLLTAGFVTVIFYGIPCCVSIYIKTWTKTVLQPHCYRTVPSSSSHYGGRNWHHEA